MKANYNDDQEYLFSLRLVIKKATILVMSLWLIVLSPQLLAEGAFDPFSAMKKTPEGKQLLDLTQNAAFDAELAKQQLDTLSATGVAELGIEYKVAQILGYLAIYHSLTNYELVARYVDELHLIGVKQGNDWVLSKYFEHQGFIALRQGYFLKSLADINKSIELAKTINYQEVVANSTARRAIIHSKMNHGSQALQDYTAALKYFEQNENVQKLSDIYSNLVVLYIDRKDYIKALSASDKAIEVQNKLPQKSNRSIAINYINRAIVLSQLGQKKAELAAFEKAQKYAIKSRDVGVLASVYANLSDYFLRYGSYSLAIERAKKCIETAVKIEDIYTQAICQLNQGLSLVHSGQPKAGLELLNAALNIAEAERMQSTLLDVYQSFIETYQKLNDYEQVSKWLTKRYELLLTQAKNDKENYFSEMENSFTQAVEEREQVHSQLKSSMMDNILNQEALVNKLWITIGILSVSLLVLLLLIFVMKRK